MKRHFYKITTALCAVLLTASTIFVFMNWSQVPEQIPTHYSFSGEVNGYGSKGSLILLIAMSWIVFISITVSVKFPHRWNMPVKVTEENRSRLYAITRAMLEVLKIFTTILFAVMFTTTAAGVPLPQWIVIILVAGVLLTVAAGMFLMHKNK